MPDYKAAIDSMPHNEPRTPAVVELRTPLPEAGKYPVFERYTPRAKKILELALREALQLGHNYIGSEHLLLGLIREGEGVGAQVLSRHVSLEQARKDVIAVLKEPKPVVLTPEQQIAELRARVEQLEQKAVSQ
jgi:ATP-dependent Clp protease ATP-binding subunit ClpA